MKTGKQHQVPLGDMAANILTQWSKEGLLFPSARGRPYNNWSMSTRKLDSVCPIPHWTLHDLRRTFATKLAELGVGPHIIERLLAHTSGTISGVAAIYNRHHFLPEMREALQRWEERLQTLLPNTESTNGADLPRPYHQGARAASR
jgi:integrase